MSGLLAVGSFLISILFSLLIFILWARLALRYCRVSSLHPMSNLIYRFSNPLITPIQHLFHSQSIAGRYDWIAFSVLIVTELIKFSFISLLAFGQLSWAWVVLGVFADLIIQPCNLLFYAILIRVVMSWINPRWHHPVAEFLKLTTAPILRTAQRYIPVMAGIDLSPMIAMIILKVVTIFISASLPFHGLN